ncbi:class I SAM-dependent methyltransferase [Thiomicrorhabdus indica]|uniref:class I SAM-dependent methyltransferase n=1 Tax=Thiomicrorhabdus indica TaxID=2267253 RepID=UPI002AA6CC6A|nr:class I SAM-dependent methyltransferase [Thiomicrorhabdus indica]
MEQMEQNGHLHARGQQILRHHGGDAEHARKMITQSYERRHDVDFWEFWNAQMAPAISAGDLLLDLGAGIGQFVNDLALRYPNNKAIGVEAANYMYAAKLTLPENATLLQADLTDGILPIEEGSVAVIMANMLIHELPQPVSLFRGIYHWLKPGGRFCIIDLVRQPLESYLNHKFPEGEIWQAENANNKNDKEKLEEVFEHFLEHNRYHATDLIFMLAKIGFEIIENTPNGRFVRLVVEKPAG